VQGTRLDSELVRRGLARSRGHASTLIAEHRVTVSGRLASKPATVVQPDSPVTVASADDPEWASRGAHKLIGALDAFTVSVSGRRALDAGASTGGFTDVLLRRGAAEVVAVDIGEGQLVPRLRDDPRVRVVDRTNVRALTVDQVGGPADVVVADLSFISLGLVLPALLSCASPRADVLPMVKPQFEVGRGRLGSGGVVRDAQLRVRAVLGVAGNARQQGWGVVAVTASPLPGPSGNVEYFLHLRTDVVDNVAATEELVRAAVREGPQ
jgi:23S rRNA (cytidine1920-2'-O)/16S rRNA (cytidine1409-2'-O)-methyltransferase